MGRLVTLGHRVLPRGWGHFGFQLALWLGFYISYLAVRSLVDQDPAKAFTNGFKIIHFERHLTQTHHLYELTVQRIVDSSHLLLTAAAWTYWNSEFTVIGLTLLWVYLRRHERFARFRNTILLANLIGLIGYALMPTAPPWMIKGEGFVVGINPELIHTFGNQYAAMPSLHAADALIVGYCLALSCRSLWAKALWTLWPLWVWFCVVATANHYLVDVLAGIAVAVLALLTTGGLPKIVRGAGRTVGPSIANLL